MRRIFLGTHIVNELTPFRVQWTASLLLKPSQCVWLQPVGNDKRTVVGSCTFNVTAFSRHCNIRCLETTYNSQNGVTWSQSYNYCFCIYTLPCTLKIQADPLHYFSKELQTVCLGRPRIRASMSASVIIHWKIVNTMSYKLHQCTFLTAAQKLPIICSLMYF